MLGLIRHVAEGERFWFRQVMAGGNPIPLFAPEGPDAAFNVAQADEDMVPHAWRAWRTEIAFAEALVTEATDLDIVDDEPGAGPVSLRWVLLSL